MTRPTGGDGREKGETLPQEEVSGRGGTSRTRGKNPQGERITPCGKNPRYVALANSTNSQVVSPLCFKRNS